MSFFKYSLRKAPAVVGLEDRLCGHGLVRGCAVGDHFGHVGLRVLLNDDVDRRRELHVAADMIAVRVGVDERGHRFCREFFDLVEDRLAPAWILRIDNHDAVRGDEYGRVPAAAVAPEHE